MSTGEMHCNRHCTELKCCVIHCEVRSPRLEKSKEVKL